MNTHVIKSQGSYLQVKLDAQLKQQAGEVFEKLGLTMTDAVKMFFKQVIMQKAIPFAVAIPDNLPSYMVDEETEKAIGRALEEYKRGEYTEVRNKQELHALLDKWKKEIK